MVQAVYSDSTGLVVAVGCPPPPPPEVPLERMTLKATIPKSIKITMTIIPNLDLGFAVTEGMGAGVGGLTGSSVSDRPQ